MALDAHFAARGAPPGSMRWHALLYARAPERDRLAAAFALEAEFRGLAGGAIDHGVAHAKLDWWREEALRVARGGPRHPLTVALLEGGGEPRAVAADVERALAAAAIELAQAVLQDEAELRHYLDGAGAAPARLALAPAARGDEAVARFADGCGRTIRLVEIVRDLRRDAWRGRIFVPWSWVEEASLDLEALRSGAPQAKSGALFARVATLARGSWAEASAAAPGAAADTRRPLQVLAELHLALLARISRSGFAVTREPDELPPLSRLFIAWRAARRA